jgi:hypothetical protein
MVSRVSIFGRLVAAATRAVPRILRAAPPPSECGVQVFRTSNHIARYRQHKAFSRYTRIPRRYRMLPIRTEMGRKLGTVKAGQAWRFDAALLNRGGRRPSRRLNASYNRLGPTMRRSGPAKSPSPRVSQRARSATVPRASRGKSHPRGILKTYVAYYNEVRTHLTLGKDAPSFRRSQTVGSIVTLPILGGLHHQYLRV